MRYPRAEHVTVGLYVPQPTDSEKLRYASKAYTSQVINPLGNQMSWQEREEVSDDPLSSIGALSDEQQRVCQRILPADAKKSYRHSCTMLLENPDGSGSCLLRTMRPGSLLVKNGDDIAALNVHQGEFSKPLDGDTLLTVVALVALGEMPPSCEVGGYKVQLADSTLATSGPAK